MQNLSRCCLPLKCTFTHSFVSRKTQSAGKELEPVHYTVDGKVPRLQIAYNRALCGQRHFLQKGLRGVRQELSIHTMNILLKLLWEHTDHKLLNNKNCKMGMLSQKKGLLIYYAINRWTKVSVLYYITVSVRYSLMIMSAFLFKGLTSDQISLSFPPLIWIPLN